MKVWSGRFSSKPAELMERFSRSIEIDGKMWREDLAVNRAWAQALYEAKLLTAAEEAKIQRGLRAIATEFRNERFAFLPEDEDIHVAIERRLTELVGATGAKIHTGRSRNDQVVTDFRLYLKRRVGEVQTALRELAAASVAQAEASQEIILPAYTHTQQAQPIRLAHYLLALSFALQRHSSQLRQCVERIDELPLGCGAVAGTAFSIDRKKLAQTLGFRRVMQNSIDATGTRSFCGEMIFICSDIGVTLSRYAHDFILWSTQEFGFIDPGEKFATGSSMMPNKKNPDAFELVRGKTGTLLGLLTGIMSLQKGIPATYSRDLQEDKKAVFEALQTAEDCMSVFAGALRTCHFRAERMRAALTSALFATDLADYLVRKGIPFRKAHELVAQAVQYAERCACGLHELPLEYWRSLYAGCDKELFLCFQAKTSVERRNAIGGTSLRQVKAQIRQVKNWLK
ncbi:argininosuccinate lyase [candidate division KSB1 bacterium]|nr:argininosuccinate lyase [candidate division KSB1 bacterium]